MPQKNNGRKRRRRHSSNQDDQRKDKKVAFSPESVDLFNSYRSDDTDTPIRLTFTKNKRTANYTISQTSTPIRGETNNVTEDQENQSPILIPSPVHFNTSMSQDQQKTVMSDDDFKQLVVSKLLTIEQRVTDLNKSLSDLASEVKENKIEMVKVKEVLSTQSSKIEDLQKKQTSMETLLNNPTNLKATNRIVIKNMCQPGWNEQKMADETNKLLKTLDSKVPKIASVAQLGNSNIIIVTLGNGHNIGDVLKLKRELRKHKQYERVYIDVEKSIAEQRAEASLRAIANVTPGLKYLRGQLQADKDNPRNQRPGTAKDQTPPGHEAMDAQLSLPAGPSVNHNLITTWADIHVSNGAEGTIEKKKETP